MALKLYERYPQLWESPSNDYPQGAFKNLSAQDETDGSYLEKDWLNDYSGFFGALLRNAEMTPNGLVDTAIQSQFYDALIKVAKESVDLSAYRKKDDLLFKGTLKVQATDDVAAGVSLQDVDGTVRGQVVATDQGLQLTQYSEDGGPQTFTFPSKGLGGEILTTGNVVNSMSELKNIDGRELKNGDVIYMKGYHIGSIHGGGTFIWEELCTSPDNGGTVIRLDDGSQGAFKRQYNGSMRAEYFGARPWSIGDSHDSTEAFRLCARASGEGGSWTFSGRHRITDNVFIPSRQSFGGNTKILAPWRHIISDPSNFQGVHVGSRDLVGDCVYYDSTEGYAFTMGEFAYASNFAIYSNGLPTKGADLTKEIDAGEYYRTVAFRFGKSIKLSNIDITLFWISLQSAESLHEENGVLVKGNYYTYLDNVMAIFCGIFYHQYDSQSYNNTWHNLRISNCQYVIRSTTAIKNLTILSGSFEEFGNHTAINIADTDRSSILLVGSYFEKFEGSCAELFYVSNTDLRLLGCTIYTNYIRRIFRNTETKSNRFFIEGNSFHVSSNYGANKPVIYTLEVDTYGHSSGNSLVGNQDNVVKYSGKQTLIEFDLI